MSHSHGFLDLVEDAKTRIKEIEIEKLEQFLQSQPACYLVDVREDTEWVQGHIPNAIHIGKGVIERDIESIIPNKENTIVLYCGGGFRSALAADAIIKMGYKNVLSLAGGYREWKNKYSK